MNCLSVILLSLIGFPIGDLRHQKYPKWPRGFTFWPRGSNWYTGVFIFSDHRVQMLFGEGSIVNTPSADYGRFSNQTKSKQGIPATTNVPESLVFSGFPDILFIPFVSIKRFTFLCKRCLWYNPILPLTFWFWHTFWFYFQGGGFKLEKAIKNPIKASYKE